MQRGKSETGMMNEAGNRWREVIVGILDSVAPLILLEVLDRI